MGLDVSGIIVVGIKLTAIEEEREVQYFDKMTGKPYLEKEKIKYWESASGFPINDYEQVVHDGISFFCDEREIVGVFGIAVGGDTHLRGGVENHLREISLDEMQNAIFKMRALYPGAEIKVYNFLIFNC